MKKETKKTLAKEILITSSILGIIIMMVISIFLYNSIQGNRAIKFREQATLTKEKFSIEDSSQKALFLEDETQQLKAEYDSLINKHYEYHNRKISYAQSKQSVLVVTLVLFILAYPVRGSYTLIKWALQTIKEK